MKKILFDVREIEKGKYSGIGRFVLSILNNNSYFDGFDFILLGDKNTDFERKELKEFEKIIINNYSFPVQEQFDLYQAFKKIRPHIYLSTYYKYPVFADVKTATCIFDLTYLIVEPYASMLKNKLYIKNFIRFFTLRSDCIITSSMNTRNDILKIFRFADESKIKVVYLPLDEKFSPQPEDKIVKILNKYSIRKPYLLYVGNNMPHKNVISLYKAFEMFDKSIREKYMLVLAGFSDIRKQYPQAHVIGKIDDEDLPALYSGCCAFVFPSVYEGFGYPPLEALACGARVIAADTPALKEILGKDALYFEPYNLYDIKNKILNVIERKMSVKISVDFSRFSVKNFIYNIKSIFDEL